MPLHLVTMVTHVRHMSPAREGACGGDSYSIVNWSGVLADDCWKSNTEVSGILKKVFIFLSFAVRDFGRFVRTKLVSKCNDLMIFDFF